MTGFSNKHASSAAWAKRKNEYLASVPDVCQGCGGDGRNAKGARRMQVHHATYARRGRELDSDLRLVCYRCHELIHAAHRITGGSLEQITDALLEVLRKATR